MSPSPLREQGAVDPWAPPPSFAKSLTGWVHNENHEHVPDLVWPWSLRTYRRMGTDGQVKAVTGAIEAPVKRFAYKIDPNDAPESTTRRIAEDLGLPVVGERDRARPRGDRALLWRHHLADVLRALRYGAYAFNIVAPVVDGQNRLSALSPRPPLTIDRWDVARDGSLVGIAQHVDGVEVLIPADHLAVYSWDREGSNWTGESMLRSLYRPWRAKDTLIRIDLLKHERNGMGVPTPHATDQSVTPAQLATAERIAKQWRVGQESAATMPYGIEMRLLGVQGTLPDTIDSARYHDEEMARALGQMVLQLGQTESGSRALGDTFADLALYAIESVADWVVETATQQVVERLVDLNEGPDAPAPRIVWEPNEDPELTVADMALLVQEGIITADTALEDEQRTRYRLPARTGPRPASQPVAPSGATVRAAGETRADGTALRDRLSHEALMDLPAIEATRQTATTAIVTQAQADQTAQAASIQTQIVAAGGSLTALAAISVPPASAVAFGALLAVAMQDGADQAAGELGIVAPTLDEVPAIAASRGEALATVLAEDLASAARRRAIALTAENALTPEDVGTAVTEHLDSLSDAYLEREAGAAAHASQGAGRVSTFRKAIEELGVVDLYASELLDAATCGPCLAVDGTKYDSIDDALKDYPAGGYIGCEGFGNCRGTLVAVHATESAPSVGVTR